MSKQLFRCAIYTRKSSEEGLEQSFNSLDAQREACEAFIASQKHEGWVLVKTPYDDGGFKQLRHLRFRNLTRKLHSVFQSKTGNQPACYRKLRPHSGNNQPHTRTPRSNPSKHAYQQLGTVETAHSARIHDRLQLT